MALVGHVEPATAAPGTDLSIKLYWRALAAMTRTIRSLCIWSTRTERSVADKDDQPDGGKYPTSFWDVGETVADGYVLALPPDLAGGDYRIEIGVYRAGDGSRLPIRGGGDSLTLGAVRVVP